MISKKGLDYKIVKLRTLIEYFNEKYVIKKKKKSKEKHKEGNPTDYQPKGECYVM